MKRYLLGLLLGLLILPLVSCGKETTTIERSLRDQILIRIQETGVLGEESRNANLFYRYTWYTKENSEDNNILDSDWTEVNVAQRVDSFVYDFSMEEKSGSYISQRMYVVDNELNYRIDDNGEISTAVLVWDFEKQFVYEDFASDMPVKIADTEFFVPEYGSYTSTGTNSYQITVSIYDLFEQNAEYSQSVLHLEQPEDDTSDYVLILTYDFSLGIDYTYQVDFYPANGTWFSNSFEEEIRIYT